RDALPDFEYKIWDVEETESALLLVTDGGGIFRYRDGEAVRISDSPAYDRFDRFSKQPDLYLAANSREFVLYRVSDDTLERIDQIPNPHGFINRMGRDQADVFWLEYGLGSAGAVKIQDGSLSLAYYDSEDGLPA